MTFEEWLKEVDRVIASKCGLTHMDLPDRCWHDNYDDGLTPEEAVLECLRAEAEEMGLDPDMFD